MHKAQIPSQELRRLALDQGDLITTGQAARFGLGEDAVSRLVTEGHWRRRASGLLDTAPGHDTFDKLTWSAALQAGTPSAIGGEAALRLYGLDRPVDRVEVWVPDDRRPRPPGPAAVRRDCIGRVDRRRGTPARVSPEDALVDLGQHLVVENLVGILVDAARQRLTRLERVRDTLDQRHRVRQRALFRDILGDLTGIESTLEFVYRRDVERAHGLPEPKRQESVSTGSRSDVWYEEQAVLVELDGRLGHEDAHSGFRDLRRDNAHATRSQLTLRYGTADVRGRPCEVGFQVWQALAIRGWEQPFQRCSRCAPLVS